MKITKDDILIKNSEIMFKKIKEISEQMVITEEEAESLIVSIINTLKQKNITYSQAYEILDCVKKTLATSAELIQI